MYAILVIVGFLASALAGPVSEGEMLFLQSVYVVTQLCVFCLNCYLSIFMDWFVIFIKIDRH